MPRVGPLLFVLCLALAGPASAAVQSPLQLESEIPLGSVRGRIDHFAVDIQRKRLFTAELGNDGISIIDLNERRLLRTITGLREPQGLAYVASTDTLYVANGGDGSVRLFRGSNLEPAGRIELGTDADNIRVDPQSGHILVGYGNGALAIIDRDTRRKIDDIPLIGHPESFELDPAQARVFVNVPDANEVAVVDLAEKRQVASLPLNNLHANFPLAIDPDEHQVLTVTRSPPRLVAFSTRDGSQTGVVRTCGDADDLFVDAKRQRVYVSCGQGAIDVFVRRDEVYAFLARIPTRAGARTSLYVPELDRLFVALRARGGAPASIRIFRPEP
ncbi:YncE family protein [Pseudaminobacter soli (ex Li et al. 2025)]|uniref:YncE family protein n=1 Tax=Pseudaminobacter soli (ex Li et al. 2025) TaxID=1295366 RepID=A0A2P7RPS6_9HYPH|nr:hypothetical protein [Mesorhizobium soli]PSJ52222.1 hypothetical protein C7I85_28985 [Mesorhizobium soli]